MYPINVRRFFAKTPMIKIVCLYNIQIVSKSKITQPSPPNIQLPQNPQPPSFNKLTNNKGWIPVALSLDTILPH